MWLCSEEEIVSLVGQLEAYAEKRTSRGRESGTSGRHKPRNSDKWGSSQRSGGGRRRGCGSQRGGGGGGRLDNDDDKYSTYTSCDGGGSRYASSVPDSDVDSPRCAAYPPAPPEFSAGTADASGESRLDRMNDRMTTVSDNLKQHRQHLENTINAIDASQAGPHTSSC